MFPSDLIKEVLVVLRVLKKYRFFLLWNVNHNMRQLWIDFFPVSSYNWVSGLTSDVCVMLE